MTAQRNHTEGFRTQLWARAKAHEDAVLARVCAGTRLPRHEVEDLWADLLSTVVQAPGSTGSLPSDVDGWDEASLRGWLSRALARDVIDLLRKRRNSEGETWVVETPVDVVGDVLPRRGSAESELLEADAFAARLSDVHQLAGADAARMVLTEAAGARTQAEQALLLGLTREKLRVVRNRLDFAASELRSRTYSLAFLIMPGWLQRSLQSGNGSGLSAARAGVVATVVAASAGGGAIVVHDVTTSKTPSAATRVTTPITSLGADGAPTVAGSASGRAGSSSTPKKTSSHHKPRSSGSSAKTARSPAGDDQVVPYKPAASEPATREFGVPSAGPPAAGSTSGSGAAASEFR